MSEMIPARNETGYQFNGVAKGAVGMFPARTVARIDTLIPVDAAPPAPEAPAPAPEAPAPEAPAPEVEETTHRTDRPIHNMTIIAINRATEIERLEKYLTSPDPRVVALAEARRDELGL